MRGLLSLLLVGAALVLCAAAIGVSAILQEQRRRRQFRDRMALVAGAYMRVNPLAVMGRGAAARGRLCSPRSAAARA